MKETEIIIPQLEFEVGMGNGDCGEVDGKGIKGKLRGEGVRMGVGRVNWDEFPLRPEVRAFMAHDGERLWTLFEVKEPHVRVRALEQDGAVWEDSCVELFVADPDGEHYYNFETNAAGTSLAARRASRTDYRFLSPLQRRGMVVESSLPTEVCDLRASEGVEWQLLLGIPFTAIGYGKGEIPTTLRLNLFKCGDLTDAPHFLSWMPIDTPTPDFHRPEFFGTVGLGNREN